MESDIVDAVQAGIHPGMFDQRLAGFDAHHQSRLLAMGRVKLPSPQNRSSTVSVFPAPGFQNPVDHLAVDVGMTR